MTKAFLSTRSCTITPEHKFGRGTRNGVCVLAGNKLNGRDSFSHHKLQAGEEMIMEYKQAVLHKMYSWTDLS